MYLRKRLSSTISIPDGNGSRSSGKRRKPIPATLTDASEGDESAVYESDREKREVSTGSASGGLSGVNELPQDEHAWHDLFRRYAERAIIHNQQVPHLVAEDPSINYDHHTGLRHYPRRALVEICPKITKSSLYPVALHPKQYVEPGPKCAAQDIALMYSYALKSTTDGSKIAPIVQETSTEKEEVMEVQAAPVPAPKIIDPEAGKACNLCHEVLNKKKPYKEDLSYVTCAKCHSSVHPKCAELPEHLISVVKGYDWECVNCKSCRVCSDTGNEQMFLFCDECDHGYHTYCVGLSAPPKGNRWVCDDCGVCNSCGKTQPGEGTSSNMRWKHEYSKPTDGSEPEFLQTLCLACSKLFRSGNFCPVCLKVYRNSENSTPMVCCDQCDRWIHIDCDGITEREYKMMSESERAYTCGICRGEMDSRL